MTDSLNSDEGFSTDEETSNEEGFDENEFEDVGEEDEGGEDSTTDGQSSNEALLRQMMGQISNLTQGLDQLNQRVSGSGEPTKPMTDEELNRLHKTHPVEVQRYIAKVQAEEQAARSRIAIQRDQFDAEARRLYPLKNEKFRQEVMAQHQRLLDTHTPREAPRILLTACEMAASRLGMTKSAKPAQTARRTTSEFNDSPERGSNQSGRKQPAFSMDKLPREIRNRVDLYAAAPSTTPEKLKAFTAKAIKEHKESMTRGRK